MDIEPIMDNEKKVFPGQGAISNKVKKSNISFHNYMRKLND